jgi:carotenoid cleavage dioxygenase
MSLSAPNAYCRGNWAPVRDELDVPELRVTGRLPADLEGAFLRIGPNPQMEPLGRHHWFDGDGMIHGIFLGRTRWVRPRGFELERQAGHALWAGIMEPPQEGLPTQSAILRTKKNVANTALIRHAGRLLALYDSAEPYHVDPDTLDTLGPFTFDGALCTGLASHPKIDPRTGEMMIIGAAMRVVALPSS